jgi:transcriptional regulator with XRE-family HTH domain
MSPPRPHLPPTESLEQAVSRTAVVIGLRFAAERKKRGWTIRELARRAGLSVGAVHRVEAGETASLATYVQLARALGLDLDPVLVDPRQAARLALGADVVHAAMGDTEAQRIDDLGLPIGLDEPYQRFRFAGRADFVACDLARRALLHTENRTRFPDFGESAGSWNAKRAYFAPEFAKRLGLQYGWRSVTHVMAVAWTEEMLEVVRGRRASFRALCPDPVGSFGAWWDGTPPERGTSSTLIVLDPCATGRQAIWVGLDEALADRARHANYAQVARRLGRRAA